MTVHAQWVAEVVLDPLNQRDFADRVAAVRGHLDGLDRQLQRARDMLRRMEANDVHSR